MSIREEVAKDVSDSLCLRCGMLVRVKPWCCACHGDNNGVGRTPYAEKNTKDKRHDANIRTRTHTHANRKDTLTGMNIVKYGQHTKTHTHRQTCTCVLTHGLIHHPSILIHVNETKQRP